MDIRRPPKWKRTLKRTVRLGLAFMFLTALTGWVIQWRRDVNFRARHPPPGRMIAVDGNNMHVREVGAGEVTFVLEAGLGDYSGSWGQLEKALAALGRVFMYDRAGLGWSEACSDPRTIPQLSAELHQLLRAAQVRPPIILVGHSLGGAIVTRYAMEHPGEVTGLLLLDPSHKDQFGRLPAPPAGLMLVMTQVSRTAGFGVPQLLMGASDPVVTQSRHVLTAGAEMRAALAMASAWGDRRIDLGHTPIYVLTNGEPPPIPGATEAEKRAGLATWIALHEELLAASSSEVRRHIVISGASHYLHRTHFAAVADAARELVERLKMQPAPADP